MAPIEYNAYNTEVSVEENGTVSGYAVVWNTVDNKKDIHYPSAYTKTVKEYKGGMLLLPHHDKTDPIGHITKIEIDDFGLRFEAVFASTDTAQKWRTLVQDGVVRKVSFGWNVLRFKRNSHGGRHILEVKMFEISLASIPIGEDTMILEVNGMDVQEEPVPTLDRFYGLAKNIGDKKLKLANQAEILKLADEYRKATQPSEDTAPEVDDKEAKLTELNNALVNYLKK